MSRVPLLACLALAAAVLASPPVHSGEGLPQPYELMRALRSAQDRIAGGDAAAYMAYRDMLSEHATVFARASDEVWKDPRNVRAAVAFVLSGGDPGVLPKLVPLSSGRDQVLVKAALAYGENRNAEATRLLADLEPRTLDPSVGGHIALVLSELLAKKDPDKALALLSEARLLAPGTMIEEAALRRESSLAAERGIAGRFEALSMQYLRRFTNSAHMSNFRRQFASSLATRAVADDAARRSSMQSAMAELPAAHRQDIYLSVAWEGVKAGKVDLVRWAARNAASLASRDSVQLLRARLCEAAVLVATDEFDAGLSILQSMPVDRLDAEEEGLLAAALHLAKEVHRVPAELQKIGDTPRGASAPRVVATAQAAMARVDALLSGADR